MKNVDQSFYQRRFAGAIRPDQRINGTFGHGQVQPIERKQAAEFFRELAALNQ